MNKKILIIISSVLLSLVLWGSVTLSNSYFTSITVPVKLTGIPQGFGVSYKSLRQTNVKIKGAGWKLISIALGNTEDYQVSAVGNAESKFIRLSNSLSDNPWLSTGLQVFDISPDTMTYRLERLKEKTVIIKPSVELNFKAGYGIVSPITTAPESVTVYGPGSLVQTLNSVSTVNRVYDNLDEAVSEKIGLKRLENINFNRNSCEIKFDVQKIVDRSFDDLPIEIINVPKGESVVLIPSKMTVVLRGGINLLGKLKPEEIRPFVDYKQIVKDTLGTIEPNLKLPFFSSLIDKKPAKLKYIIKKF